jgi:DNA gyrase/topoisomerase IV subunit B
VGSEDHIVQLVHAGQTGATALNVLAGSALLGAARWNRPSQGRITGMSDVSPYFHALKGRLRIKILKLKGSAQKALEVEEQLQAVKGVRFVRANPTTGNVLIRYNPGEIEQSAILDALQSLDCLRQDEVVWTSMPAKDRTQRFEGLGEALAESLVRTTMELALQRLVSALI